MIPADDDFDPVFASSKPGIVEYLRRLQTHALAMEWLLRSVMPKPFLPRISPKKKRAITHEEHRAILVREHNPERHDFYDLLWHTGASQGDAASLLTENVNWQQRTIFYCRRKLAHHEATALRQVPS